MINLRLWGFILSLYFWGFILIPHVDELEVVSALGRLCLALNFRQLLLDKLGRHALLERGATV